MRKYDDEYTLIYLIVRHFYVSFENWQANRTKKNATQKNNRITAI